MLTLNFTSSAISIFARPSVFLLQPGSISNLHGFPGYRVPALYYRFQWIRVMCQPKITALCLLTICNVPLKFIPEMADCTGYRPCCRITKRTNGVSFYSLRHIHQQIDIAVGTVSMLNLV